MKAATVLLTAAVKIESDPICSSAGCTQFKQKKTPLGYDLDYFVPNFGPDQNDVITTQNSLGASLKMHGRGNAMADWKLPKAPKEDPPAYNIYPLDVSMQDSLSNLEASEGRLGKWTLPPKDENVQLESDPICSSAGCTQYKQKKTPLGYDLDYFVPNFGPDRDVIDTEKSILNAEMTHTHKLIFGTKESRAKYHNKAKDVDYNFAPELDEDIKTSNKNLAGAEKSTGHKWEIEEEEAYTPYFMKPGFEV